MSKVALIYFTGFLLTFLGGSVASANAANDKITPVLESLGEILPGELVTKGDAIEYRKWTAHSPARKTVLFIHFSARLSIKAEVDTLKNRIIKEQYNVDYLRVVTVADFDDALWGTKSLAALELKANKKSNPDVEVVRDNTGAVRNVWSLPKNTLFVALFSASGKPVYQHTGPISESEMNALLKKINEQLTR